MRTRIVCVFHVRSLRKLTNSLEQQSVHLMLQCDRHAHASLPEINQRRAASAQPNSRPSIGSRNEQHQHHVIRGAAACVCGDFKNVLFLSL